MDTHLRTICLGVAVALCACSAASEPPDTGLGDGVGTRDTALAVVIDPELGIKTYRANCQGCHGADGEGGAGVRLNDGRVSFLTQRDVETIVREGSDDMPAFGSRLGDPEIEAVAEYVITTFGGE